MTPLVRLLSASWLHVRRHRLFAILVATVAAAATAGLSYIVVDGVNRGDRLLDDLSGPSARSLVLRASDTETGFDSALVDAIVGLPGTRMAVAISEVRAARNARWPDGSASAGFVRLAWLKGPQPVELTGGRLPRDGEALLSESAARTLGIAAPGLGSVSVDDGRILGTTGTYSATPLGAISDVLSRAVVSIERSRFEPATVLMTVDSTSDVAVVVGAIRTLLSGLPPNSYSIEFDARAADVADVVGRTGQTGARRLGVALALLCAGVEALIALFNALTQRRSVARWRALGSTRAAVLTLLTFQSAIVTVLGVALGSAVALGLLALQGQELHVQTIAAAGIFVLAVGVLAAVPGGLFGAFQDPATVLRVP